MNPESWFLIGHIVCISQWCAFIMVDYAYLGKGRVRPLWLWTTVLVAGELFLGIKFNIGFFTLLSIWENVGFVLVSVRNRVQKNLDLPDGQLPRSTKKEPGHGMGLWNVTDVLRKYQGEYTISCREKWFRFTCSVPVRKI